MSRVALESPGKSLSITHRQAHHRLPLPYLLNKIECSKRKAQSESGAMIRPFLPLKDGNLLTSETRFSSTLVKHESALIVCFCHRGSLTF